jgi:hypothetical protein
MDLSSSETVGDFTGYGSFAQISGGYSVQETSGNDSGIFRSVQIPIGAHTIAFSYRFTAGDEGDQLVVTAGGQTVPLAIQNLPMYRESTFEGRLNVSHLGGTTQVVEFRLAGVGEANTSIDLTNITFVISNDVDHDGLTNDQEIALGSNPLSADSDLDGLTDAEELNVYGTDPNRADTDGDGVDDFSEVTAGTSPTSAASLLRISNFELRSDRSVQLMWPSVAGKKYRVVRSGDVARSEYLTVGSGLSATSPNNTFIDAPPLNSNQVFYWVEVEPF